MTQYTGARGKSGTSQASAEFMAEIRNLLDDAKVVWQTGELGKVDLGGGGTVAMYIAALNVDVVDVGVPGALDARPLRGRLQAGRLPDLPRLPGVYRREIAGPVPAARSRGRRPPGRRRAADFPTVRMVRLFDFLGPFSLIVYFAVGIIIGVTIFPLRWLRLNGWLQTAGIALTLFSMGASMAGSPTFLTDLRTAGVRAFLFAAVTIAGSVLLVYILSRITLPRQVRKKEDAE